MKQSVRFLLFAFVPLSMAVLIGCGGSSRNALLENPPSVTPAIPVAVVIAEDAVTLGAGETYHFVANVTGTTNTAVTWTVTECSGGQCGTVDTNGNYTAPALVASTSDVRVVATAQADPTKLDTVTVHHEPIAVFISPKETWLGPNASLQFSASTRYDVKKAGVTWSLTCATSVCGTLTNATATSVLYTAPASFPEFPAVTLTAASVADPAKTAKSTIAASSNSTLAAGEYAFVFRGWEISISGGYYWPFGFAVAGHFHADGKGNIVDGVEDINSVRGIQQSLPFTGTYAVGADRRGVLTFVTSKETATYRMVLDPSGTRAQFIRFDGISTEMPISGAGTIELQDSSALSMGSLNGDYAMGVAGAGSGHDWRFAAAVGRFSVDPAGAISAGSLDSITPNLADPSQSSAKFNFIGSLSGPSTTTGRGTATLAISAEPNQAPKTLNFAYYVVSGDKLLLVQIDPRTAEDHASSVLGGEARRQHGALSAATFSGPAIFSMAGLNREGYGAYFEHVEIGQLVPDGTAGISGVVDDNGYPYPPLTNQAFHGTYTFAADGRAELQLGAGYVSRAVAYFYGPNQAFLMETSPGTDALFGNIRPQAPGPFDPGSISGTFLVATPPPTSEESETECGLVTFDGSRAAISTMDVNSNLSNDSQKWLQHYELTGTYDVAPNGRGTLNFGSQDRTIAFWIASPTDIVGNAAAASDGWLYISWAALLEFSR